LENLPECSVEQMDLVNVMAEKLRQEPYRLFRNNCFTKSIRLRSECRRRGIKATIVWCALGLVKVPVPMVGNITIPLCIHWWAEACGQRVETSRPLGSKGHLGIVPSDIRPIITVHF